MNSPPLTSAASAALHVKDIFLARQPILDRAQKLVAYELLFRHADVGSAAFTSDLAATAAVISHVSQLGLERVIGNALGFLNVDAAVLQSDIFQFLPREKVILEIVETMKVTPEILARIAELCRQGFRFALDDVITDSDDVRQLLPHIDVIKLDLRDMPLSALLKLTPRFKAMKKRLLAEKVETLEQFELCLGLGFDYFQGYYFAKPAVLSGKKLSPSQLAIANLLMLVQSDASSAEVARAIKQDISISLNLLRLANCAAVGARTRIDSLNQALLVLGRAQLQRWLQIMQYAEPNRNGMTMTPLLMLATTRGRLLELMAQKLDPSRHGRADTAFTVGIMSLMDTLLHIPMAEILDQIPVVEEVAAALLERAGSLGEMLKLVECLERIEESAGRLVPALTTLRLSNDDLYQLELAAFEWSNGIISSTPANGAA